MPTACIQCALKAYAEEGLLGVGMYEETPEEHMARVHPEGVTPEERARLMKLATKRMLNKEEA